MTPEFIKKYCFRGQSKPTEEELQDYDPEDYDDEEVNEEGEVEVEE